MPHSYRVFPGYDNVGEEDFEMDLELLPLTLAPIEKQIRVIKNGEVLEHGTDWTFVPEAQEVVVGSVVTQIRMYAKRSATSGGTMRSAGIRVEKGDDTFLDLTGDVSEWEVDDGTHAGFNSWNDTWDNEMALAIDGVNFRKMVHTLDGPTHIKRIGWTMNREVGSSADRIARVVLELNIGTVANPEWIRVLRRGADNADPPAHDNTIPQLAFADYNSTWKNTGDVLFPADCFVVNLADVDNGGETIPADMVEGEQTGIMVTPDHIELTTPLTANDKLVILRETRSDRPWVRPTPVSRMRAVDLMNYWNQMLFIFQELCELVAVSDEIGWPVAAEVENDYTSGSQAVEETLSGVNTMSFADVELLTRIPGAPSDPRHQLVVERFFQDQWHELEYDATPADATEYSVDAATQAITFGASVSGTYRIRRQTRIESMWCFLRDGYTFNSVQIGTNFRQLKFLFEEACRIPQFYEDSPLNNPIFPRGWNFLNYVMIPGQDSLYFGGPGWGGDGFFAIYENDVLLEEGVDYDIDFPFNITFPPMDGGEDITVAGNGGYGGLQWNMPGMDEGDEIGNPVPIPPPPPIPGGPAYVDPEMKVALSISFVNVNNNYTWEGTEPTASSWTSWGHNSTSALTQMTRIEATLLVDAFGESAGAKWVGYFRPACSDSSVNTPQRRLVIQWSDRNGTGTYTAGAHWSAALVCLQGNLPIVAWASAMISSALAEVVIDNTTPPDLRMAAAITQNSNTFGEGVTPFWNQAQELWNLSGAYLDGTGGNSENQGWTGTQLNAFIDPNEDFTDFNIPEP